jgi:hypothetical protein
MLAKFRITLIAGGNDTGKSFSTDILNQHLNNDWTLSACFRSGLTAYENLSILIYGTKNQEFVKHMGKIKDDVLIENTKMFHSNHLSFGFYLKAMVSIIYGYNFVTLLAETDVDKEKRNILGLRKYLYEFGEHAKKFDDKVWAKALFSILENTSDKIKNNDIIINDLRFVPELIYVMGLKIKYRVIHLTRYGGGSVSEELLDLMTNNPEIDYKLVENNCTVAELEHILINLF